MDLSDFISVVQGSLSKTPKPLACYRGCVCRITWNHSSDRCGANVSHSTKGSL